MALKSLPRITRRIVIADLQVRFHSTIEIGEIQVRGILPLTISVRGIVLRYHGRYDVPPLMAIERLTGSADLHGLWTQHWHVTSLHLEGLRIHIPPPDGNTEPYLVPQAHPKFRLPPIEFTEVTADNALVQILPRQNDRKPRSFWIRHLTLRSIRPQFPAHFQAQIANDIPTGDIESEGTVGPWDADQPGLTPVAADFEFTNANLGQFRGLAGTLSSKGRYEGVLERLNVEGDASVPNFSLSISERPVALRTHYVAVIDGTNGSTYLKTVEAHFLHSSVLAKGEVINAPALPGRKISLTVMTKNARAEDLLQLVTRGSTVPISGKVNLQAQFELPSGKADVFDRLSLSGQFEIARAVFTSHETQEKIDLLSRRGQGEPKNEAISDVLSNIRGRLRLGEAEAYFPRLEFTVPGAFVSLKGSYGLKTETIDLHGQLKLSSKLSQTTTGIKSALLRVVNPLFKDGARGGSTLPIKITGPRSYPSFGLDLRRRVKVPSVGHEASAIPRAN